MARPFENLSPKLYRQGPPPDKAKAEILMLHGAWHGAWCWEPLNTQLAEQGYGVNCLDLPGHGQDRRDLPALTSVGDYADVAKQAAGSLGNPVLIAHSMGGWVAQKVLESVDLPAVFLAPLPGNGMDLHCTAKFIAQHLGVTLGAMVGRPAGIIDVDMARRLFFADLPQSQLEAAFAQLVPEPARVFFEMGLGLARARPAKGKSPRLLIASEDDYFFPVKTERKLAETLGAEFMLLSPHPHNLWMEDPQGKVLAALLAFSDKL